MRARRFRNDDGATDPVLVIAAIATTLVLLVGGSYAYANISRNAQDAETKSALSNVALAEATAVNNTGAYVRSPSLLTLDGSKKLETDSSLKIYTGTNCFAAFQQSQTRTWLYLTSNTGTPVTVASPWPSTAPTGYPSGCVWPASQPVKDPSGMTTTIAGSGSTGERDGTGTAALFASPADVTFTPDGHAYVVDQTGATIRKVTPAGVVTTFAGSGTAGYANGTGTAASFSQPNGITSDDAGNLYVTDSNNNVVRMITPAGVVTTLAGSTYGYQDSSNPLTAKFGVMTGIAATPDGKHVLVADYGNNRVRDIIRNGTTTTVTTIAGNGTAADTAGPAGSNSMKSPRRIATTSDMSAVYITTSLNNVMKLDGATGVLSVYAGTSTSAYADGPYGSASFSSPQGITVAADGAVYVADKTRIRKLAGGQVTTVAGSATSATTDGTGAAAAFKNAYGVAVTPDDSSVWVADFYGYTIRAVAT